MSILRINDNFARKTVAFQARERGLYFHENQIADVETSNKLAIPNGAIFVWLPNDFGKLAFFVTAAYDLSAAQAF